MVFPYKIIAFFFSTGNLALTIVKGPLEALLGVAYGVIFGIICWYLPHKKHVSDFIRSSKLFRTNLENSEIF